MVSAPCSGLFGFRDYMNSVEFGPTPTGNPRNIGLNESPGVRRGRADRPRDMSRRVATSVRTPAARWRGGPVNSVLDCRKIETVFGIHHSPWRVGLTSVIREVLGDTRK